MTIDQTLVAAYEAWQRLPGAEGTAGTMEDICKRVAVALGVTTTQLRDDMNAARRNGLTIRQAVDEVIGL